MRVVSTNNLRKQSVTLAKLALLPFLIFAMPLFAAGSESSEPEVGSSVFEYSTSVYVQVESFEQAVRVFRWLDLIKLTEIGRTTLEAINDSGNRLLIYHHDTALYSAGLTGARLSKNLVNGVGEDAFIKFYLDMEMEGTNCVRGEKGGFIEFTALQNLFHELSHARHKMNGTWLYFDSEGQAIREENIFRQHWAEYRSTHYYLRNDMIDEEDLVLKVDHSACGALAALDE